MEPKKAWDPDFKKRKNLLEKMIPEFAINLGGATSIDVTKPDIDKAYGMHKLEEVLKIEIAECSYKAMRYLKARMIIRLKPPVRTVSRLGILTKPSGLLKSL